MSRDDAGEPSWLGDETGSERDAAPWWHRTSGRTRVIGQGLRWGSAWALRLLLLGVAAYLLLELIGLLWVGLLPVILSVLLSTLLWPVAHRLRRWRFPTGAAAGTALLLGIGLIGGILGLAIPQIVDQAPRIARSAAQGIDQVQHWLLHEAPINLDSEQLTDLLNTIQDKILASGAAIASGIFSTVAAVGSFLVGLALVLVLTFLMLKDGDGFLPWLRRWAGPEAGGHLSEALQRVWVTLSGYLRTQALVALIDAVAIGIGLVILGVPLAVPLALITFLGGFIPIVGAILAGVLAVLVALVTEGLIAALLVVALVLAVQQLEGNVLSPILQGRVMQLHPAVILLSVAAGGTWFGIIGAFLAVPTAAALAAVLRYLDEQVVHHEQPDEREAGAELRAGETLEPGQAIEPGEASTDETATPSPAARGEEPHSETPEDAGPPDRHQPPTRPSRTDDSTHQEEDPPHQEETSSSRPES